MSKRDKVMLVTELSLSIVAIMQGSVFDTSFKNIALQSNTNDPTTQTANLTAVFKQVENSVVQITARTPNPNLQVIINGNPLGGQSTRLGSGFVYDKQGHI